MHAAYADRERDRERERQRDREAGSQARREAGMPNPDGPYILPLWNWVPKRPWF